MQGRRRQIRYAAEGREGIPVVQCTWRQIHGRNTFFLATPDLIESGVDFPWCCVIANVTVADGAMSAK